MPVVSFAYVPRFAYFFSHVPECVYVACARCTLLLCPFYAVLLVPGTCGSSQRLQVRYPLLLHDTWVILCSLRRCTE